MARFRDIKTLQKFASVHASIHSHFNQDRHLNRRDVFIQNRSAALAEWRQLYALAFTGFAVEVSESCSPVAASTPARVTS